MTSRDHVIIFDLDGERAASIAGCLFTQGLSTAQCHRSSDVSEALRRDRPSLIVVVESGSHESVRNSETFPGLVQSARSMGIPTIGVVEVGDDSRSTLERVRRYDDWVSCREVTRDLPIRVASLVEKRLAATRPLSDPRFLGLIVHDLRTPLNVIVLTIRAIAHSVPQRTPEFDEDLLFLQENAMQTEKMLALLGEYCRLMEGSPPLSGVEFAPHRFLSDLLEDRQHRPGSLPAALKLEIDPSTPPEVALDPSRTRLAFLQAMANALTAAGESPIKIRSSGREDRWIVEMIVDKAPPTSVNSVTLRPGLFERLTGSIPERRGFDLAIVALITEIQGGSARLEIEPGRRSTIVLEWPLRFEKS